MSDDDGEVDMQQLHKHLDCPRGEGDSNRQNNEK